MNFLERGAIRRAERKLSPWLVADERVLEFDVGHIGSESVHCIATSEAAYLVFRRGNTLRIPYDSIRSTGGGQSWFTFATFLGTEATIEFGRGPRRFHDTVVGQYQIVARQRRRFHAAWCDGGATFLVGKKDGRDDVLSWTYDDTATLDPDDEFMRSLVTDQALNQLRSSLGVTATAKKELIEVTWDPPLPSP
jgi:hypothetical protein